MKRSNESGSHLIALAIGVLVVGVIALAGYRVWQMQQPASNSSNNAASTATTTPTTIKTTADLTAASKALDDAATQVNANLNDGPLATDINSML